jgi:uncharacterized protein
MTDMLVSERPQIDDPQELDRVVRRLVQEFDPVAIYFFGSRARGDADRDSDYDLMLVLADDAPPLRSWEPLVEAVRSRRIDVNPFITRSGRFSWRRREVGTLEYEVQVDGIRLYPTFGEDLRDIGAQESTSRSMNTNVVEEWLRRVERDLVVARKCCEGEDAVADQGAYHVQQAAEKLTKAVLVAHKVRPRKGHKIEEFAPLISASFPHRERFLELEKFSKYAWAHRYPPEPGHEPIREPSTAEVQSWIDEIEALKGDFERWLGQAVSGAKRG